MAAKEKILTNQNFKKRLTISIFLIFSLFVSFGQTKTITVYCKIYPSMGGLVVDYFGSAKYLPDSTKTDILVDYKKKYHLRNGDEDYAILLMGADGWKLVSSYYYSPSSQLTYILSREICLEEPAFQSYSGKLRNSR